VNAIPRLGSLVVLLTLAALFPAASRADNNEALNQRLEGIDDQERTLLAPYLERGSVGLVELSQGDVLPAVSVASYVEAPADLAARVIGTPADYPKFMRTLDHVEVLSKTASQTAYKWTWQTGVLFLEGENRMTALAPPKDKPQLGHRISVKSERGQLGEGRLMWRVIPVSPQRSLVSLSMRVDMRDANFVMRQLDAAARSVNRSVNIALCYVMLLGAKREAERQTGRTPTLPAEVAFQPPKVNLAKLHGLLGRGDLLLMELTDKGLGKLGIVARMDASRERLAPIINEPEMFGKSLVPGSYTRVTKREGALKTFSWGIGLPLIGTSGTMTLRSENNGVALEAIDGALKGGRWRFDTPVLSSGEAAIVGYSQFDISKASWLIEKITSLDPVMGHGLAAATQVMLVRALRKRAHDENLVLPAAAATDPAAPAAAEPAAAATPSASAAAAPPPPAPVSVNTDASASAAPSPSASPSQAAAAGAPTPSGTDATTPPVPAASTQPVAAAPSVDSGAGQARKPKSKAR
jgi:hypothetical protein